MLNGLHALTLGKAMQKAVRLGWYGTGKQA
jgi:hypothetical protein